MEQKKFDVFVIGTGGAGQTVAETCVKNGMSVAVADNRVYGGTCANRGCDAKKVLLGATEVWERSKSLKGKGIDDIPELDWKKIQKFKQGFTKAVPAATESRFKELGIKLYHQSPVFENENTLSVEGKTVNAKHIVIATGQVPKALDMEGSGYLKTSDDFLDLKKIPKHIVFIGGGYVGMEFAHMAARAGSNVTILEHGDRPLKAFEADLVAHLVQVSKDLGIQFQYNVNITGIKKLRKNYKVAYHKNGKKNKLKTRMVFNTAGRVPAISHLGLEKGKVAFTEKGIKVNQFLQNTTNPNVYACGDVSDHGLPLTSLTGVEASVVAKNILEGNKHIITTPVIPSAVFTLPNLASVGMSEQEAKRRYKKVSVNFESVPQWYNAKRIGASAYVYKIISNDRTKAILGAHLLAPHAAETINLFAMAIQAGLSTSQMKSIIFTYPSWGNDIKSML